MFAQFNQPISLIGSVTSDLLNSVYSSMQFAIDDVNETVPLTS